jgi:6-phosphogluconate dehydrogenase
MIGGEPEIVQHLDPVFHALAPGIAAAPRTPGAAGEPSQAENGYLHCGPNGGGHFVKMVHNGIEYAIMAAYSEGLNIIKNANAGRTSRDVDAETTPLRNPEYYRFEFDISETAEVWRRGSVIGSWLLDLTATALRNNPELTSFEGHVSDSGEGRWTVHAAIDEGVPAPVISAALFGRFESRGLAPRRRRAMASHISKISATVRITAIARSSIRTANIARTPCKAASCGSAPPTIRTITIPMATIASGIAACCARLLRMARLTCRPFPTAILSSPSLRRMQQQPPA